jgi:hypothetical protein
MIIYIGKYLIILLALVCLCLSALHPFLQNQMPLTDDGTLHLYRIIALDDAIQQTGQLYPRYAPGLVYGYGAPLFNYFSPLAYYPSVLLHHLGLSYIQAWLGAMCFYIVLAAVGAYCLGAYWTNRTGGFIAAAAYVYAPYFLFDAVRRGTLTEVAALAVLPLVVWAFGRLRQQQTRGAWLLASGIFALFIPLHNIVTILGMILVLPYCALLWLSAAKKFRTFFLLLSAGIVGVLLTTFFWLPALGETGNVKINAIAQNLNFVDVTQSLRPLSDIFIPTFTADPTQLQQPIPIVVGWIPVILAFITMVRFVVKRRNESPTLYAMEREWGGEDKIVYWLFWLCLAITIVMILLNVDTPLSVWLWRTIPLLGYTQFAWRTLGIASLTLALIAGISIGIFSGRPQRIAPTKIILFLPSMLLASLIIIYSFPWLVALYTPLPADSIVDAQNHERITGQLALSSYSEYLPNSVEIPPDAEKFIGQKNPFARLTPPAGVTIHEAQWRSTSVTLALTSVTPVTLVFDWLYVPGWSAQFTNTPSSVLPLSVKPSAPHGLVSVEIPTGEHILEIGLQNTPLQSLANGISLLAISGWLVAFSFWLIKIPLPMQWGGVRGGDLRMQWGSPLRQLFGVRGGDAPMPSIILIGIALLLIKIFIVDIVPNPFRAERFAAGNPGAGTLLDANFGNEIQLISLALSQNVKSGDFAPFSAFWRLFSGGISQDYSSIYQLRNSAGLVIAETGSFTPGNRATSAWLPNYYLQENLMLKIPTGTPPGTYTLDAGLYAPETGERLSLINAAGNPVDVKISIGQIQILPPDSVAISETKIALNAEIGFAGLLDTLPETLTVGAELILGGQWVALQKPVQAYQFQLVWQKSSTEYANRPMPLISDFPATQWQAGDVWNGHHALYVPGNLDAGDYAIFVQLIGETGNTVGEKIDIGVMQITTPERSFEIPDMPFTSDAVWQNGIRLRGYAIVERVTGVTLIWQTAALIDQNLRLFVHVLEGETIVAQWDGIPAEWTRPTTSWLPGEVITTQHNFDVPPGDYDIRIGWYDPATNERVLLDDNTDTLTLMLKPSS